MRNRLKLKSVVPAKLREVKPLNFTQTKVFKFSQERAFKLAQVRPHKILSKSFSAISLGVTPLGQLVHSCDTAPPSITSESLRLVSLNVAHGRSKAFSQALLSRQKIEQNLNLIGQTLNAKAVDILALQEADAASIWSGRFDHVEYLRNLMSLNSSVLGCHMETGTLNYGTAIVSRAALHASQSIKFEPTPPTTTKGFVVSTVKWRTSVKELDLTVVSLHLDFARSRARDQQVDALIEELGKRQGPFIVMGDMNCDWGSTKSQVKRLCETLSLVAYEPRRKGLSTFGVRSESRTVINVAKRLDWILISEGLAFKHYEVLPEGLSDHQAVFAEITMP